MFGLINVYKNELKIKDYELFKSYYCGLCKSLGKHYNQFVRLGLSYDMTFLAILADSLSEEAPCISVEGCVKHIGKHKICKNEAIEFSADMSILLTYHKLTDDICDEKSIKSFLARIPYYRAFRKVSAKHPKVSDSIKKSLLKLSELERSKCSNIDEVADPFATLTASMFSSWNDSLSDIGYNIGRFIYIADAYSDIEYDYNKNQYNPYLCKYGIEYINSEEVKKSAMASLNMTLHAISDSYVSLNIKKNKDLLENIIYMGLRNVYDTIFKMTEVKNG